VKQTTTKELRPANKISKPLPFLGLKVGFQHSHASLANACLANFINRKNI
jgi:hypothetical protein